MKLKPIVFIAMNTKGGAYKSAILAFFYYICSLLGVKPLVIALDVNPGLLNQILIPHPTEKGKYLENPEVFSWDINSIEEARAVLPLIVQKAIDEGRPIIIDLPAKGGKTKGIYNLLRSGALRYCTVIGIAPVRKNNLVLGGAIEAYEDIKPDRWIQVNFGAEPTEQTEPIDLYKALSDLKPNHVFQMEMLEEDEAREIGQQLPVPFAEISEYAAAGGPALSGLHVIGDYWNDSYPKVEEAVRKVAPELLAPPYQQVLPPDDPSEKAKSKKTDQTV
ncbi:hypothetical protein JIN84_08985 [Luteolibacter yonseiensis]|uniref:ParA family protein n=1 Tax=Luteolibacter yonseiensis TaxID=1144680 RepID=A0A934VB35_9BACT|nr:hypothetical protein [Luteolibacter yonseiensis]MBK1815750.1 hypothetical protein [Luteolibacter yonseiensis]